MYSTLHVSERLDQFLRGKKDYLGIESAVHSSPGQEYRFVRVYQQGDFSLVHVYNGEAAVQ